MVTIPERPKIYPDADSHAFWSACSDGILLGQRCAACGLWRWPPREHCSDCHTAAPEWLPLPGTGTIEGAVVLHRAFDPAFIDEVPSTIVHVAMDGTDGRMLLAARLVPSIAAAEAVGACVRVSFHAPNGQPQPIFKLAGERND